MILIEMQSALGRQVDGKAQKQSRGEKKVASTPVGDVG